MSFLNRSGMGGLQDLINGGRKTLNELRGRKTTAVAEPDEDEDEDIEVTHEELPELIENGLPQPFCSDSDHKRGRPEDPDNPWATCPNALQRNPDGSVRPGKLSQFSPAPKANPTAPQFHGGRNLYQRICKEWEKIADPDTGFAYFCRSYVYINNQKHGYMKFDLYGYQERLVKTIRENRFVITKKFRQAGASLLTGVYCLWYSLTHPRMQCMVVSIGLRESSKYLQENVREIYEALPQWLRGGLRKDPYLKDGNKDIALDPSKIDPIQYKRKRAPKDMATEMALPNKSKIRSVPTGKAAGRGFTTKLLVIDEAAFIENVETFYTGAYPTINNSGGSVFVISTVNGTSGIGGWYYNTYKGAVDGTNKYMVAEMSYDEHPDYNDPEWVEDTMAQLGERGWRQEVLGEFLASGNTYIDADYIAELETLCRPPKIIEKGGKLWIWEEYQEGHHYSIGADCATRGGLDYSSAEVIDIDTGEQVAEYRGKLAEGEFAKILAELGYRYGNCLITPEMNAKAGGAVTTSLQAVQKYKRIYSQSNGDPGWNTTSRTRNILIADLETILYGKNYHIRSTRLIDELKTFIVTKRGKIEHDSGAHDDCLFSFMIATTPEVIRKSRRLSHRNVTGIMADGDLDTLTGTGEIPQVKPIFSTEEQNKELRKKRQAIIGDTTAGAEYLRIQQEMKEQGCPDDTLAWLLS